MPEPLILVTTRAEKVEEARRLGFDVVQRCLELPEPQAIDPAEIVEAKAHAAFARLRAPVLVEDSGLAVSAWGGFPGALVKWMEKSVGLEGIARMLDAFPDRSATAVCVVASYDGKTLSAARGQARGSIAASPRGSGGFGWDRLFVPEGETRTFAEMSPEEKDRRSHRRQAWEALSARLRGFR
ncbi:MAG: non-canonical purine NTP pyrophosphatase [Thermoanaerobaculia bacterium]